MVIYIREITGVQIPKQQVTPTMKRITMNTPDCLVGNFCICRVAQLHNRWVANKRLPTGMCLSNSDQEEMSFFLREPVVQP